MGRSAVHPGRRPCVGDVSLNGVDTHYAQKLLGHPRVETTTGPYLRLGGGDDEQIEKLRSVL